MKNDETKTDAPERLSAEWHAQRCDESATDRAHILDGRSDVINLLRQRIVEEYRDRAAKLRRLDVLEAEVARLREMVKVAAADLRHHLAANLTFHTGMGLMKDIGTVIARLEKETTPKEAPDAE